MYYQDHTHPQRTQQPMGIPFPPSYPPQGLQDYSNHPEDTPSSMDEHISPTFHNENGKRPSISGPASASRKRVRKESDLDADASVGGNSPQDVYDPKEGKPKATRGARACTVCRRLKMKCVVLPELKDGPCKRCQAGNHECIFEESNRGKRSSKRATILPHILADVQSYANIVARKHEQLTKSLRKMERTLDTVLRSISNPALTSLAGGMVSQSPSPPPDAESSAQEPAGTPDRQEFPNAIPEAMIPHIPKTATYGAAVAPVPGSPRLHSLPDNVLNPLGLLAEASSSLRRGKQFSGRSPDGSNPNGQASGSQDNPKVGVANLGVYFKPVCAISSKFYTDDEELHTKLTKLVNKLAWSVPERGYKSVEIVQAYLLLCLWGSPVERYEHDRTWMLLGMAIRMATDLNLHRKNSQIKFDSPESRAREVEIRNRERTWLLCFILDRSFSAQMGKPNVIKEE
ncbi:17291_t:CDS:2 [Acaulospora colombiana]|uniref:17291_t:CDS:1 n=1 Tax=Acaulospora colombiana TaxID=27376 RepID=A0ACA9N5P3_9GLOM|nr:17291_t:CDS:2 [Acaulospora colombiana]